MDAIIAIASTIGTFAITAITAVTAIELPAAFCANCQCTAGGRG
jgi:hypothetical protein